MNFTKSISLMIVATVFGLWLSVYLNHQLEAILSYILILSFGLLHGAHDVDLIGQYLGKNGFQVAKLKLIVAYVLFVLIVWCMFYLFPVFALGAFILLSSYHFGEQHWGNRVDFNNVLNSIFYLLYGGFILFIIFYVNVEQVSQIVDQISEVALPETFYSYGLLGLGSILGVLWVVGSILGRIHQAPIFELFLLGVFFVIFKTASLLLGFCIYFVIWHSIPSLLDQIRFLYGELSWKSFLGYLKNSLAYWLVSIVGVVLIYLFLGEGNTFLVSGLICFLAAITFPHVLVMSRIERHLKTDPEADIGS